MSGDLLLRSLLKALAMKKRHTIVNEKFNAILPADLRQEWQEMISRWEQDKSNPNPYTHTEKGNRYHTPRSVVLTPTQPATWQKFAGS